MSTNYLSKKNLQAHVCTTELGPYAINGIHMGKNGTVSTDGCVLIQVPYPEGVDPESFREVPFEPSRNGSPIIPAELAKTMAGLMPTKAKIETDCKRGHVRVISDDLGKVSLAGMSRSLNQVEIPGEAIRDVDFPAETADKLLETAERNVLDTDTEICLDISLLQKMLKAGALAGADMVRMRLPEGWDNSKGVAMLFQSRGADHRINAERLAIGVQMPVNP